MKRYLVLAGISGVAFFTIGIGWGIWSHNRQAEYLARSQPLRILCGEKWLSNEALENFSRRHNVRIQQWTYARPSEFLRQMANADGNVDVICTSSLLVKSLVHSHWLKKLDYQSLPNAKLLAVDFSHLPYDPESNYSVPVLWNLYGFFGKGDIPKPATWKHIWQAGKVSLWGEELNVLELMNRLGLNVEQRLQEEETSKANKSLDEEIHRFTNKAVHFIKPSSEPLIAESILDKSDWVEVPLARVAHFLADNSEYGYWLPEDGATVELGVLAVGEKSTQADVALQLIDELLSTDEALAIHQRLDSGIVHSSLSSLSTIPSMQKPEALRMFPLNRLMFPDLNVEALPRFQKIFDETVAD